MTGHAVPNFTEDSNIHIQWNYKVLEQIYVFIVLGHSNTLDLKSNHVCEVNMASGMYILGQQCLN